MCSLHCLIASEPGFRGAHVGKHFPRCVLWCLSWYTAQGGCSRSRTTAHRELCVCEERASWAQLCFSCYPYAKHLLETSFLVTPSCGATAKQSTYVPARRCKSARIRKKKGWGDVCVRRRQKFQLFRSQVISLFKKRKKKFTTSILFFLPLFPRDSCFSLAVFLLHRPTVFFSGTARRGRKESMLEEMKDRQMDNHNLKKTFNFFITT